MKKVYIKTFGCVQNTADSERIKAYFWDKGFEEVADWKKADVVVINTCVIRESAENRAYGLINKINKYNMGMDPRLREDNKKKIKIMVTGCLTGVAVRDKSGKKLAELRRRLPMVDEFLSIDEVSFKINPLRNKRGAALIIISSGCNNFCSYCIVPFARGKEISRPFEEIIAEAKKVWKEGFKEVVLIGQNVNSYGADLINPPKSPFSAKGGSAIGRDKGDFSVHMGKKRFRSLFPKLLEEVAKLDFDKVSFLSSNPWDFSDELIEVISKYPNVDRLIHLPFQAGDNEVLKKMNRGYTKKEYLELVDKIRRSVEGAKISTDIIVGFPGEDEKAFLETIDVCKKVNFDIAYINKYSPRKGTVSARMFENEIPQSEKKRRWKILDDLVNKRIRA